MLAELKKKLEKLVKRGMRKESYCLTGGLPNEALTIEYLNEKWRVYYSERGNRTGLREFEEEQEACDYFYEAILRVHGRYLKQE